MTKCIYCKNTLKKIRYDWKNRSLHIKCHNEITTALRTLYFIDDDDDDDNEYRNRMIEYTARKCNLTVEKLFRLIT